MGTSVERKEPRKRTKIDRKAISLRWAAVRGQALTYAAIAALIEARTGKRTTRQMVGYVINDTDRSRRVAEGIAQVLDEESRKHGGRGVTFRSLFTEDEYPDVDELGESVTD